MLALPLSSYINTLLWSSSQSECVFSLIYFRLFYNTVSNTEKCVEKGGDIQVFINGPESRRNGLDLILPKVNKEIVKKGSFYLGERF